MSRADDIRHGRRGGRSLPAKSHDQAAIDRWKAGQAALERAAEAAGEQLSLLSADDE